MLTLASGEVGRLQTALGALLSPLDHAHVNDWRVAVTDSCKALLGADIGSFVLPIEGRSHMYSREFDAPVTRAFPILAPRLPALSFWHQQVNGEYLDEYFRSAYYNDYIVPARAFDSIGITIPLAPEIESHTTAGILFHHDREDGPVFGERGLALLRLLRPAFEAGVATHLRLARCRTDLVRLIDGTGAAVLVLDPQGRELHRTPALTRLLLADAEGDAVLRQMRTLGLRSRRLAGGESWPTGSVRIPTAQAEYRANPCFMEQPATGSGPMALVTLSREGTELPAPEQLRERFGLTRRQAQVALLLPAGRSNDQIARELFISPHTARHITQQVLLKLSIHSRAEVAVRVLQASDCVPGADCSP